MSKISNLKLESKLQEKLQGKVLPDEPLKKYTTMQVGGPAKFLYQARDSRQLAQAVRAAVELGLPYFVLGAGGNIIFSDQGFEGLVILNRANGLFFFPEKFQVLAESGIRNGNLATQCGQKGWGGIEFLAPIPGTLGGSIYGNAGAYGWGIGSFVKSLNLLIADTKNRHIKLVKKSGKILKPLYRSTIFKRRRAKNIIILSAVLQLQRKSEDQIRRQIQEYIQLRKKRQPRGIITSGSVFKNPLGRSSQEKEVYKDIKKTAAYMLDKAGAKRLRAGDARVSAKHANFITHSGKAAAQDIKDLVDLLQNKVYEKFGVKLETEIEFVGDFNSKLKSNNQL